VPRALDDFLLNLITVQHLYLSYIISILLILTIWKQFVQASVYLIWPLSYIRLGLTMLIAIAEILTFRVIANFGAWLIGFGMVAAIGGAIRLNNLALEGRGYVYSSDEVAAQSVRDGRIAGALYVLLGLLIGGTGAAFLMLLQNPAAGTAAIYTMEMWTWGILIALFAVVLGVMILDRSSTARVLKGVVKDSDLIVTKHGGIHYAFPSQDGGEQENESNGGTDLLAAESDL
jgi:hypothetical protein